MRITKMPVPLLIAAIALTGVTVIYVYLQAPPMPIHTDPNFTMPLFGSATYLWRGAAFEYLFSADEVITVAHLPAYHLIYLTGPLANITVDSNKWIVYLRGGRPLYVELRRDDGYTRYLIYKLTEVTPNSTTISGLTVWMPTYFDLNDLLSDREIQAIETIAGAIVARFRVLEVNANATHLRIRTALPDYATTTYTYHYRLTGSTSGKTVRVTNTLISGSYTVNGTTYMVAALPYRFFSITPTATTTLVVYVN